MSSIVTNVPGASLRVDYLFPCRRRRYRVTGFLDDAQVHRVTRPNLSEAMSEVLGRIEERYYQRHPKVAVVVPPPVVRQPEQQTVTYEVSRSAAYAAASSWTLRKPYVDAWGEEVKAGKRVLLNLHRDSADRSPTLFTVNFNTLSPVVAQDWNLRHGLTGPFYRLSKRMIDEHRVT
jgi:hypothetical protein